eukprot:ctg_129.g74
MSTRYRMGLARTNGTSSESLMCTMCSRGGQLASFHATGSPLTALALRWLRRLADGSGARSWEGDSRSFSPSSFSHREVCCSNADWPLLEVTQFMVNAAECRRKGGNTAARLAMRRWTSTLRAELVKVWR